MIKVREIHPLKISGRSSLYVTFDYNQEIIDIIKGFQPAVFHKKLLAWEVPSFYLARLLDSLTRIDDIELTLLREDESQEVSCHLTKQEIDGFKYTPFKHQIDGINFLLQKKKALLLDTMGCGKSLQIMYLAEVLHERKQISHCLIICGVDSLRSNWKTEIQKFSRESVMVLGEKTTKSGKTVYETISNRVKQLLNPINEFFVIVNVATLRDPKIIQAIMNGPNKFDMIAVDEIHMISTTSSHQGNNLLKLNSNYKVAATGTPLKNTPLSIFISLHWTENDASTLTNYKAQYCNFGGFNSTQVIGYKNLDVLQDEIDYCSIRRTFDMIKGDMPKKTIEYELVEMSDEHAKFYKAIESGVKEEADKIELKTNNLLALTTRLRQATSAPSVLTTQDIMSSKVERAAELVEEILASNEKVVVFCNFVETTKKLNEVLSKFNPVLCTGAQTEDEIKIGIEKFKSSSQFNLLIATTSKMGVGFSFPEAHYAIFIDQPFTSAQFAQACDRIYRITSSQPVFIKVLLCKDTIDERVRDIVEYKQELSDYVIDNAENTSFTEELKDIIFNL